MCSIVICEVQHPTLDELTALLQAHPAGAGVAFRDLGEHTPAVVWAKGWLNPAALLDYCKSLPFPYIVHARNTAELTVARHLTQPWPIEEIPSASLWGRAEKVLFMVGRLPGWAKIAKTFTPDGTSTGWTPARTLAAMVARGDAIPSNITAVIFSTNDLEVFGTNPIKSLAA